MKAQKQKLKFKTNSITELNDHQLLDIKGGTTPLVIAASVIAIAYTYYATGTKEILDGQTN